VQTRIRGYARSVEETNEGAAGLAVPIFDAAGALAGLSIVGPLARRRASGPRSPPRPPRVGEIRRRSLPPLAGPSRRPPAERVRWPPEAVR
jgi:hypothetical protein